MMQRFRVVIRKNRLELRDSSAVKRGNLILCPRQAPKAYFTFLLSSIYLPKIGKMLCVCCANFRYYEYYYFLSNDSYQAKAP